MVLKNFTNVTEFSLTSQRHKISHNNTIEESKQIKELHSLEHEVLKNILFYIYRYKHFEPLDVVQEAG